MKNKDMILKEAIEERQATDDRAVRAFGDSGEALTEV